MSNIGKRKIDIPLGVDVNINSNKVVADIYFIQYAGKFSRICSLL